MTTTPSTLTQISRLIQINYSEGLGIAASMSNSCRLLRCVRAWAAAALATAALAGCQTVELRNDPLDRPIPDAMVPPRELRKVSLPTYRIEPPDIVAIDMPKMVPLPPYPAEVYDVLEIRVSNALMDQPIDNYFMVEAEGVVNLGPAYGTVRVVGMTLDEAKKSIEEKLSQMLREPEVSVKLGRVSGSQPLTAQYLVAPDGTINLRQYGLVHVAGLTVTEAKLAIQKHLAHYLDSPELSVDVVAYNSKVYYIITQGAGIGDNVRRFPVTGNETVLDAISQVNGLSQLSSTHIWIARPAPGISPAAGDADRLVGDHAGGFDGDELSALAWGPVVYCPGRDGDDAEHGGQGGGAIRAVHRLPWSGRLDGAEPADRWAAPTTTTTTTAPFLMPRITPMWGVGRAFAGESTVGGRGGPVALFSRRR